MTTNRPTARGEQAVSSARRLTGKAIRRAVGFAALVAVAAIVVATSCRAAERREGPPTREQVAAAVHVCSTCHGRAGRRTSPNFPRLAGQRAEYLGAQLRAFRDKTRLDPPHATIGMASMAAHLDNAMIARLAAYYSALTPMSGAARHPAVAAAGRTIYAHGIPGRVLPCMACHGASAQGSGATPRLAGQDHAYLEQRMAHFAADPRADALMHQEAMHLTAPQIAAVTAYLAAQSPGKPAAAAMLEVCSSCHEFDGRGADPAFTFPRLAGQQKEYLSAQLKAFRGKTRADPRARAYMWGVAAHLDDAMIARLATHYAAQAPMAGSVRKGTEVAAGRTLYEHGIPGRVLPCMACHGTRAEGAGTTPRLAGQHRLSLERQLTYFAANTRADGLMHQEAMHLTAAQIGAVSAYLSALREGKSPATRSGPVTSREVAATILVCSSCHDFNGRGAFPAFTFPRLAGQQEKYLSAQLKAFRAKTRADPRARTYMWAVAAHLDDAMIARLAADYSARTPVVGSAQNAVDVAAGRSIYEQGIPDRIPPCMTCHGAGAEGGGTTPRLAGQRRLSLERQLAYFAANTRADGMMHTEAMHLTARQITDISAYLASR